MFARHSTRLLLRGNRVLHRSVPVRCLHFVDKLPYDVDAFEPHLTEAQLSKHVEFYVRSCKKLNDTIEGTKFELMHLDTTIRETAKDAREGAVFGLACNVWSHREYFKSITPHKHLQEMSPFVAEYIDTQFGSLDALRKQLKFHASGINGSGFTWLVIDEGQMRIMTTFAMGAPVENKAENFDVLLGFDCWEHSYVISFDSREDAFDFWWSVIDWSRVEATLRSNLERANIIKKEEE